MHSGWRWFSSSSRLRNHCPTNSDKWFLLQLTLMVFTCTCWTNTPVLTSWKGTICRGFNCCEPLAPADCLFSCRMRMKSMVMLPLRWCFHGALSPLLLLPTYLSFPVSSSCFNRCEWNFDLSDIWLIGVVLVGGKHPYQIPHCYFHPYHCLHQFRPRPLVALHPLFVWTQLVQLNCIVRLVLGSCDCWGPHK